MGRKQGAQGRAGLTALHQRPTDQSRRVARICRGAQMLRPAQAAGGNPDFPGLGGKGVDKLQTDLPIYAERFQVTGINLDEPRSALPRQAQVRCVKNLHHGFQAAAFGQLPQAAQQGHVRGEPAQ